METKKIDFMNNIELKSYTIPMPSVSHYMIQPPFICGFIGTCGSGKTYSTVKLIIELINEGALKPQDIYIISPTYYQNEIFRNIHNLKKKNILTHANKSYDFLDKLIKHFTFCKKVWKTTRKKYTSDEYEK